MLPRMGRVVFWPTMPGLGDPDWPKHCGSGGGWTTLLADDALVEHQQRFPWTPWLAFDPAEYTAVFGNLGAVDTREAIERRLQWWSPSVATRSTARLRSLVVEAARATAGLHAVTEPRHRTVTREHFVGLLGMLDVIAGPGLEMLTPSELAVVVLEGRAALAYDSAVLERSDRWHGEAEAELVPLGDAAVRLGATAFANGARPAVEPPRVWWLDSQDEVLLELLTTEGELAAPWGGGIVALQPASKMDALRSSGLRLDVIARRADAFEREFAVATPAQLERDWGTRRDAIRQGTPVPLPPLHEHLTELLLEQWVTLHRTHAIVAADHPQAGGALAAVKARDTARLLQALGRRDAPEKAEDLEREVLAAEAKIEADLALFIALSTLPDWAPMRSTYDRLQRVGPRWTGLDPATQGGA